MPRAYPAEFRLRAVSLVRAGSSVTASAADLGITDTCLYNWVKQDRIDRGEIAGVTTGESRELRMARRRIAELESEVEILRRANAILDVEGRRPKAPPDDRHACRRRVPRVGNSRMLLPDLSAGARRMAAEEAAA